jgi:hypothetical protein
MKRRDFLKISGGAGIAGLVGGCTTPELKSPAEQKDRAPAQSTIFVRYEANSPEAKPHLESYAKAVAAMKEQPTAIKKGLKKKPNGLNWSRQAEIHLNNCPHGTWAFFPWHRDYLRRFEDIIRQMSGDASFALPYWDWTSNPELPRAFVSPDSSLFMPEPSRQNSIARQISKYCNRDILAGIMGSTDFESFMGGEAAAGEPEYGPHNGVHITIGETMATFRSPLDPIFWLHHCNVDRLWAEWQEKNPDWLNAQEINDKFPGWTSLELSGFYDTEGQPIAKATKAEDMLSTYGLGYCYNSTVRQRKSTSFNFLESKSPSRRKPAGADPERTKLAVAAFTRNDIARVIVPTDNTWTAWRVSFPDFKGNVGDHLDSFMRDPNEMKNFEFRLKVTGMPKLMANTSIRISYDPTPEQRGGGDKIFLSNYNFFTGHDSDNDFLVALNADTPEDLKAGHHHNHLKGIDQKYAVMPDFHMDYRKLLEKLYQARFTAYPQATSFFCEFFDNRGAAKRAGGNIDFSTLRFKLIVLEKVGI